MRGKTDAYVVQVNKSNMIRSNVRQVILILSFLVVLAVFWGLKLTGITMAGEAFCGKKEHVHDADCLECPYEEHIHDATCYSDFDADIETEDDWEMSLAGLTRSFSTAENVVSVAMSQLGYEESTRNFEVDANGIRRGITRYGQWYGNPYGDWSAMFAAFCLHYAGVEDVPFNAGAEAMRREWKEAGMYAGISEFSPRIGNLLFLHREYEEEFFELPEHTEIPVATPSDAERIENVIPEKATPSDAEKIENAILEKASPSDAKKIENMVAEKATPSDAKTKRKTKRETVQSPVIVQESEPEPQTEIRLEPSGLNAPPDSIVIMQVETDEQPVVNIIPTNVETEVLGPGNTVPSSIHADPETLVVTPAEVDAAETAASAPIVLEGPPIVISAVQEIAAAVDTPQTVETVSVAMAEPPEMTEAVAVSAEPPEMTEADVVSAETQEITEAAAEPVEVTAAMPSAVASALQEKVRTEIQRDDEAESMLRANAVAIITGFEDNVITVIEGDLDGMVDETYYYIDDPALLGYGLVAEEPILMMLPAPQAGATVLAKTTDYDQSLFNDTNCFVVYTISGDGCFAFDGVGNAIPIYIDEVGDIYTDIDNPDSLLWTFTSAGSNSYLIQNVESRRYMHAYPNNGTGVTTSGAYSSTLISSGVGVKIRSNSEYARLDVSNGAFVMTQNQSLAAEYQFGIVSRCTVWLDGTQGGLQSYGDAANSSYSIPENGVIELPTEWETSSEYNYTLRGWYDIVNHQYYAPGENVTVTEDMVFYADWVASTYDIGQFNAQVADTVSTNEFITTRMFDYNTLFNLLSASVSVNVSESGHSETWSLITNGSNPYNGNETLDYIFRDWDAGGDLSYPANTNSHNTYSADIPIHYNLYSKDLAELLFGTDNSFDAETKEGVIGKQYLGTADHLFRFGDDPNGDYYGYYYYDSELNAASYNQSDERFYVYDYLERTTASASSDGADKYSDFLPLNSPYANTGGNDPKEYTYAGKHDEYLGVTHYTYDADDSNGSDVATNYHFGMSMDVDFYLPNDAGSGQNYDVYGNEMHFKFSGDDDVWVLVDGKLVLDIGGIHGIEGGDINFSTGNVTINGEVNQELSNTLKTITAGEHVLTFYYLERGSSMSNCAVFFNLAPRFSFSIQKEDVLTRDVLNGAQFSVYTDEACTQAAQLWPSEEAHDRGEPSTNVFTIEDGIANMWGMGASNTYYIKETKPPDMEGYGFANGIIRLTFDKSGAATYKVIILEDGDKGISNGFTVHGFRIDEETQQAYIIATNAPTWVETTTKVQVRKQWQDNVNHSADKIIVYLTVTDLDGTVRRLQEVELSDENDWGHVWERLPEKWEDGTPIQYGVEEAYISGYYSKSEIVDKYDITTITWETASSFENGQTYILGTKNGYLSTLRAAEDTGYMWVSRETAVNSPLALWTTTVSGQSVKFTNGAGQTITFYYNNGSPTDFFAKTGDETTQSKQMFKYSSSSGGLRIYYAPPNSSRNYYLAESMTSANKFNYNTNASAGLLFTPMKKVTKTIKEEVSGWAYLVTNTPLEQETSLAVEKHWDYGNLPYGNAHEQAQVTVGLLANGKDTGRTVTLSLKSNWKGTFRGLPYVDSNNQVIQYSIVEKWDTEEWIPEYGEVITIDGTVPTYSTTVKNKYRRGFGGPELPSTGTSARLLYILCGTGIILATLVYGIGLRRKRERRKE